MVRRRLRLTPRREDERRADRVELCRVELGYRLGEQRAGHGSQVIEADDAVDRHPVSRTDLDLCGDPSRGAGHERDDDVFQPRDRLVPCEYDDWSAAFVLELEPAHFAASYQGSSRIASRAFAAAQVSSIEP